MSQARNIFGGIYYKRVNYQYLDSSFRTFVMEHKEKKPHTTTIQKLMGYLQKRGFNQTEIQQLMQYYVDNDLMRVEQEQKVSFRFYVLNREKFHWASQSPQRRNKVEQQYIQTQEIEKVPAGKMKENKNQNVGLQMIFGGNNQSQQRLKEQEQRRYKKHRDPDCCCSIM